MGARAFSPVPRLEAWHRTSRVLGGLVILLAALVITGWALGLGVLMSVLPGLPPMTVDTAAGFLAVGAWLAFLSPRGKSGRYHAVLCWGCGLFIALVGLAALAQYLTDFNGGSILAATGWSNAEAVGSRPMTLASALNFLLLGTAILLVQKPSARMFSAAQAGALLALLTALCALIGYGYDVAALHRTAPFTPMALTTAVTFILCGAGFLLGTAKLGWMTAAAAETSGGRLLRQLVPVTLIVATSLGWMRLRGEALGWYEPPVGTSLLVMILIVIYSLALWVNSRQVDRSEHEAQQRRDWLRTTLASIGDAVIATDTTGRVTFLNPIAESLTGWSSQAAQGQPVGTVFSLVNEETGERGVCPIAEVLETGRTVGLTNQTALVSKAGQRTSIEDSAAPIKNAGGDLIGVVMVFRDVTHMRRGEAERKQGAEAVRVSEEQYRMLFDSMEEGFCTIEVLFDERDQPVDYRFVEINPAFEKQTGLTNVKGKRMRELAPQHEQHWFDIFGRIALTGEPARCENRAEALGRWYEVNAFRVGPAEQRRVGIVFNDITERKRREDQVREAGERFRFLAESMPQKMFTARPNGDIDYFNQQWTEFTGLSFEQIRDWGWVQFVHPDDVEENVRRWKQSVETGEPFYLEHRFRRADGAYRWHVTRAHAMRDEKDQVVMWIGSNTDIDDVRQAKEEVERASRTKDEFLAALSHELRTPLTPVLMTATVLRDDDRLPLDAREQLAMMKRNVELEARLIDDLLDLTRISHGKLTLRLQACDAHALLKHAVEMVRSEARAKRLAVEIDLRATRAQVMGDPTRLQQVFWNLLKNAVKFTPESGRLSIRSHDQDGKVSLEIADTGVGIAPEAADRIFLPFGQAMEVQQDRRFGGLGLGLAISKAIVDLHEGEIRADSGGLGQGATFRVELPLTDVPVENTLEHAPPAFLGPTANTRGVEIAERPLRVLLVEDHEATIQVLRRLLTRAGHHVTPAMTVADAMQAAESATFDVVISDLGLPDGTGFELMHDLRDAYKLRGIALSGYGMDEDLRRSKEAGFAAHLIKPVDFAQLQQAVTALVAH